MNSIIYRSLCGINIVYVWLYLKQHFAFLFGMMVTAGLVTYFILSLATSIYTSETKISIMHGGDKPRLLSELEIQQQIEILKSDYLIKSVLQQVKGSISEETYKAEIAEKSKLELDVKAKANIVSVRFSSVDRVLAKAINDLLVASYISLQREKKNDKKAIEDLKLPALDIEILSRQMLQSSYAENKKGAISLLMVSVIGFLGIIFAFFKEFIATYHKLRESELDEYHHQLDATAYQQIAESKHQPRLVKSKIKAKPAFKGIYPWQPEEKITDIIDQLESLRENVRPFRLIMAAEASGIDITEDAIKIARDFANKGAQNAAG